MTSKVMSTLTTVGLALALSASAPAIVSHQAEALDFKKLQRKVQKDFRGVGKKLRKDKVGQRILQGAGAALVVGGLANGDLAPALVGVALIAAPEVFKNDMRKIYGSEWAWSGCVDCNNRRVLVAPGRKVSREQQRRVSEAVKDDVKDVQRALATLGLYKKGIDGDFGKGTRRGVKSFQASLGQPETGSLTGEERYLLFTRAADEGYARQAAAETSTVTAVALVQKPEPALPTIKEYRLAESQFDAFNQAYLSKGDLTSIKEGKVLPDGSLEFVVEARAGSGETTTLRGGIEDIAFVPHAISDQWVSVVFTDPESEEKTVLNTVDTFKDTEAATAWIEEAGGKATILAKLTERDSPATAVAVAEADVESDVPGSDVPEKTEARAPGSAIGPTEVAAAAPLSTQEIAITATDAMPVEEACYNRIYVSFNFPEGETPISHYNIIPPEKAVIFDNGDSSAYVTGTSCVRGTYNYSYVYVQKDDGGENWTHQKREGSFEVAGLAEQCQVDLNRPAGSAEVTCF